MSAASKRDSIVGTEGWSLAELDVVLDQLRSGASFTVGGSRQHRRFSCRAGEWICEDVDEGVSEARVISEHALRQSIQAHPDAVRALLRRPHEQAFRLAYLGGQRELAREQLEAAARYGDPLGHAELFIALLGWPEREPSPEAVKRIRAKLAGHEVWHAFMGAVDWEQSPTSMRLGVRFVDRLVEMVGDCPGALYLRASFRARAGELDAALADLLVELERPELEAGARERVRASLDELRAASSTGS